ncbi:MAG: hypothetical protein ACOXZK_12075 [Bacteroidales bacterium]|jgi:hypothetical protein
MKTKFYLFFAAIFIAGISFVSCDKDDTNSGGGGGGGNDNQPEAPIELKPGVRHYFTSASYGDIIQLTIDGDNSTYSFINETTGETGSGPLSVSSNPKLNGIFQTVIAGKTYHTIELPGVAVISTLKLGNTLNSICFGISSDIHVENDYTMEDYAGKYLFLNFDDSEKDPDYTLGGYEVFNNGAYTWTFIEWEYNQPIYAGEGSGTFYFAGEDNSRVEYVESDGYSGFGSVLPGKLFLMDNGEGYGFAVGVETPSAPITKSQIAGSYKFVSVISHGVTSVGYYSLPATGNNVTFYETDGEGNVYDSADEGAVVHYYDRIPSLNNVFKLVSTVEIEGYQANNTSYFILLPGEMMMYFALDSGEVVAYGLALKVN